MSCIIYNMNFFVSQNEINLREKALAIDHGE